MAMELKQEINSDPRKKFHMLRRLKKAAKHADHLSQLSEWCERCDARTRLEAQVRSNCQWRENKHLRWRGYVSCSLSLSLAHSGLQVLDGCQRDV